MTRAEAERLQGQYGVPFLLWAEQGFLELCGGPRIDLEQVEQALDEEFERRRFQCLLVDPYNARAMSKSLHGKGVPVTEIRQGTLSLSEPTKTLERLIVKGKIRHGDNPLLTWCASNCSVERDKNANLMLRKPANHEKIDPMAAAVNALAGALSGSVHPPKLVSEAPRIYWS